MRDQRTERVFFALLLATAALAGCEEEEAPESDASSASFEPEDVVPDAGDTAEGLDVIVAEVETERRGEPVLEETISAGFWHSCGLVSFGVHCWGYPVDVFGDDHDTVMDVYGPYTAVSAGMWHTCALRSDGFADCWGDNREGQCDTPEEPFVQVVAGGNHSCGLREDGTAICWGRSEDLPRGQPPETSRFIQLSAGTKWIDWYYDETCGVTFGGEIECWTSGPERNYDMGDGPFVQATLGLYHLCGLRADGEVVCSMCDAPYCRVDENVLDQATPPAGPFESVNAGGVHTCALRTDHTAECWGYDASGMIRVPDWVEEFTGISAGGYNTCAMTEEGIQCWGSNTAGQSRPTVRE
ncbi:MAG: alpha-tubulin suppressor-like RCC1 family protein [Bradymonadia bacterium]|jgi:alpha-tubulin suppressor-like RCC1 family protein